MKLLLGLCFIALILIAGMAIMESGKPDTSFSPFPYPTSAEEFVRNR